MSLPEQFGRYEVINVLGQGAMGLVYRAVDPVIERAVAVKVIQPDPGLAKPDLARAQARFEQEFRSAGALSHSNIVTVFDVGKEGDLYYIAMEYVEGDSLDAVLSARRVLSFRETGRLARELGGALDYAHGEGVVHRDIKPANVLMTREGSSKVTDFGLAKLEATTLTRTGALVGTPAYMSPEQVGGHQITGASDQFSLGILLYRALTGERPFTGDSPSTIMYKIVHEQPLPAGRLNGSIPPAVDGVLARALHKDPTRRFPTCTELADGLCRALDELLPVTIADAEPEVQGSTVAPAAAPVEGRASGGSLAAPRAVSGWVLALAIVVPSVTLIAIVAFLVMSGRIGVSPAEPEERATPSAQVATDPLEPATDPVEPAAEAVEPTPGPVEASPEAVEATPAAVDTAPASSAPAEQEAPAEPEAAVDREAAARAFRANIAARGGLPVGMPGELRALIDAGQVRTGRLHVGAPFAIGLRLRPAGRMSLPAQVTERLRNAEPEVRRRLAAGFFVAPSRTHELELPAGNWRIALVAPAVLFLQEEQVVVRPGRTVRLGEHVPTRVVAVNITSRPAGARLRVDGLPAIPTPYSGPIVVGEHRFEFVWRAATVTVQANIERDGQDIIGIRQD